MTVAWQYLVLLCHSGNPNHMTKDTALDDTIKKFQTLKDLLDDPYIAEIAFDYLAQRKSAPRNSGAAIAPPTESHNAPRKSRKRKRGALVKKVFEVVKSSTSPLSAKDVADMMERDGYNFSAEDRTVSVSKVLRG